MNEVITMVEGEVDQNQWEQLVQNYKKETNQLPEFIKQTFLIQSQNNPKVWRIVTHWRSQKDLDEMKANTDKPLAVRLFELVGAKPNLVVWDTKVCQQGSYKKKQL